MKEIILALLRILETLIGKEKEGSNKVLPLLVLICLVGGGAIYFINKETILVDPPLPEVTSSSGGNKPQVVESQVVEQPEVTSSEEENIKVSEEEFNAKNDYKIIWASNKKSTSVYKELDRMKNIVEPDFKNTSIKEVYTGRYSLIVDSDIGKSIEDLEKLKDEYNKILQNIALESKNKLEYQIGREPVIYVENEYIDNAISNMKREYNNGDYDKAKKIKQDLANFISYSKYSDIFKHYEDELKLEIQ